MLTVVLADDHAVVTKAWEPFCDGNLLSLEQPRMAGA
jgi:hypothetical protein